MEAVQEGIDTLSSLEQRITHAVEVIVNLRGENERLQQQLSSTQEEVAAIRQDRDEAAALSNEFQKDNSELQEQIQKLKQDLDEMRGERKQVKARIEKLLGQMDLLSAS